MSRDFCRNACLASLLLLGFAKTLCLAANLLLPGEPLNYHRLSYFAVSPLPIVFDSPDFFSAWKVVARFETGKTREFSAAELKRELSGPWHRQVVPRHAYLFGNSTPRRVLEPFVKYYLCGRKILPVLPADAGPIQELDFVYVRTDKSGQRIENIVSFACSA